MSKIQKGKSPEINLEPEMNQPQNGFKVTLQKTFKDQVQPGYSCHRAGWC